MKIDKAVELKKKHKTGTKNRYQEFFFYLNQ
jgi:hypothetical protein